MADNTTLNSGSGGDVIRTEAVGAVKINVGKIYTGAANVDGGPVTPTNPFPVMLMSGTSSQGSVTNPFFVTGTLQSGSVSGLLVGGQAVAGSNPLPVILYSGSSAFGGSSNPLQVTGTLSMTEASGKVNASNKIKWIVPASITAVNILSASLSNNRTMATIFNHGNASLYMSFGGTPTINDFDVKIGSASYYELPTFPVWQDAVTGIWDSANGFAMINDFTGSF